MSSKKSITANSDNGIVPVTHDQTSRKVGNPTQANTSLSSYYTSNQQSLIQQQKNQQCVTTNSGNHYHMYSQPSSIPASTTGLQGASHLHRSGDMTHKGTVKGSLSSPLQKLSLGSEGFSSTCYPIDYLPLKDQAADFKYNNGTMRYIDPENIGKYQNDNIPMFPTNFSPSSQRNSSCIYTTGNMNYPYSDCRLDNSWTKCAAGPSSTSLDCFNQFDGSTKGNNRGIPMVSPGNAHMFSREQQNLSTSQLASLLPYIQAFSYQQSEEKQAQQGSPSKMMMFPSTNRSPDKKNMPRTQTSSLIDAKKNQGLRPEAIPRGQKSTEMNSMAALSYTQTQNSPNIEMQVANTHSSLPSTSSTWPSVDKSKSKDDCKKPTEITRETPETCIICGSTMESNQCPMDSLMPSKMSISDKLSLMTGCVVPKQPICTKCYQVMNEVDLLESRLSNMKKDICSSLEKNCAPSNLTKKTQGQIQHSEMSYFLCQNLISPQQAQSQAAYLYYSDQQMGLNDSHHHNGIPSQIDPMALPNEASQMSQSNQLAQYINQQGMMHSNTQMVDPNHQSMVDHFHAVQQNASEQAYHSQLDAMTNNQNLNQVNTQGMPIDATKHLPYQGAPKIPTGQPDQTVFPSMSTTEKGVCVTKSGDPLLKNQKPSKELELTKTRETTETSYAGDINKVSKEFDNPYNNSPYGMSLQDQMDISAMNKQVLTHNKHVNLQGDPRTNNIQNPELYQYRNHNGQMMNSQGSYFVDHQMNYVQPIQIENFQKQSRSGYYWSNDANLESHFQGNSLNPPMSNGYMLNSSQNHKGTALENVPTAPMANYSAQPGPQMSAIVDGFENISSQADIPKDTSVPCLQDSPSIPIQKNNNNENAEKLKKDVPNATFQTPEVDVPTTSCKPLLPCPNNAENHYEDVQVSSLEVHIDVQRQNSQPEKDLDVSEGCIPGSPTSNKSSKELDVPTEPLDCWTNSTANSSVSEEQRPLSIEELDACDTLPKEANLPEPQIDELQKEETSELINHSVNDDDLNQLLPMSQPLTPEGLRNVQDATEYHKPTLLGKTLKTKKHAKLQICRQCDQVFSNRQSLVRHIEKRHKVPSYSYNCENCNRKFHSEKMLQTHAASHKSYPCSMCLNAFPRKTLLKQHVSREHSKQVFECTVCKKQTSSMQALIAHIKSHNTKDKLFKCETCQKIFACKRNLDEHQLIHSGEKPFSCDNCDRTFRHRSNMVSHNLSCTKTFKFTCDTCPKKFAIRSTYLLHLRRHKGEFKHKCSFCKRGFSSSMILLRHFEKHSNPDMPPCSICSDNKDSPCMSTELVPSNRYQCDACPKSFPRKDTLRDHINFHKGTRNYQCPKCAASFFYRGNLYNHVRGHLKQKNFKCSICEKCFSKSSTLIVHIRTHTKEKPYECKACGKLFSSSSNYKRHQKCHITAAQGEQDDTSEEEEQEE